MLNTQVILCVCKCDCLCIHFLEVFNFIILFFLTEHFDQTLLDNRLGLFLMEYDLFGLQLLQSVAVMSVMELGIVSAYINVYR